MTNATQINRVPTYRMHGAPTWTFDDGVPRSIDQIMEATGTDYEYQLVTPEVAIVHQGIPCSAVIPDKKAVIRYDREGNALYTGMVGNRWKLVTPRELDRFVREMAEHGLAVDTFGFGGKREEKVFLSFKMLEAGVTLTTPDGEVDTSDLYLFSSTTLDGSGATNFRFTNIRTICSNQWTTVGRTAITKASVRHSSVLAGKEEQVRTLLGLGYEQQHMAQQMADRLAKIHLTGDDLLDFADRMFPKPEWAARRMPADQGERRALTMATARRDKLVSLISGPNNKMWVGTGWGAYNAATEYFDHYPQVKQDPRLRVAKAVDGALDGPKARAYDLIVNG